MKKQYDLIEYIEQETKGINVLSLFDGISCGRVALEKSNIPVKNYYASEIDKFATQVSDKNYPEIIRLGDVTKWQNWDIDWSSIDLVLAGSPCQGFSFAGKQLNFEDPRSKLFFDFVDILNHIKSLNPKVKFLLENVKMKQEYEQRITDILQVEPIKINSSLISAQNRVRLYWCNWEVEQPDDLGIMLKDVLQEDNEVDEKYHMSIKNLENIILNKDDILKVNKAGKIKKNQNKSSCLTGGAHSGGNHSDMDLIVKEATKKGYTEIKKGDCVDLTFPNSKTRRGRNMKNKSNCLTAAKFDFCKYVCNLIIRRFTPIECERLQTLPDNYTAGVSDTQRYKALGNGWTVDVIAHILKGF